MSCCRFSFNVIKVYADTLTRLYPRYEFLLWIIFWNNFQGLRIGVETLATILAPLWIAPTLNFSIFASFSFPTLILLVGSVLTLLRFWSKVSLNIEENVWNFCIKNFYLTWFLTIFSYRVLEPRRIKKFQATTDLNQNNRYETTDISSW